MQLTNMIALTASLLVFATSGAIATPLTLESRDVFVPPVLSPNAKTVWKSGEHHTVVWDTRDAPVNITNKIGSIRLRKGGLSTPLILASNFSILAGRQVVTVPNVVEGSDYQIVLFGDSGNFSPEFTITGSGVQF